MEKKRFQLALRSKFITLEGIEGTGKSTQAQHLRNFLKKQGVKAVVLRDPGNTPIGEKIRAILLNPQNRAMSATAEMLLYMAARTQLVDEAIIPALKRGKTVICDRFLDATRVYQGLGGGVDLTLIEKIGKWVTRDVVPDLTIVLDIGLKQGLQRSGRKDRMEQKPFRYHRKVKRGYLRLARMNPRRIKVVAVKDNIRHTQEALKKVVLKHFGLLR